VSAELPLSVTVPPDESVGGGGSDEEEVVGAGEVLVAPVVVDPVEPELELGV
jgi:hypothetical protein